MLADVISYIPSISSPTETPSSTSTPSTPPTINANKIKTRLHSNNSPTNLIASSSTSFSSRPPASTSSTSPSVASGSPNEKTPRSRRQNTVSDSHQDALQKVLSSSRTPRTSGFGVQKRYHKKPHIYQHEVCSPMLAWYLLLSNFQHKQNVKDALSRKLFELSVGKGPSHSFCFSFLPRIQLF